MLLTSVLNAWRLSQLLDSIFLFLIQSVTSSQISTLACLVHPIDKFASYKRRLSVQGPESCSDK